MRYRSSRQIFVWPTDSVPGLDMCAFHMYINCTHDTGQINSAGLTFL